MNQRSTFLSLVTLLALGVSLIACNDHREFAGDAKIPLVATLSGAAEKPMSVSTAATGSFVGVIDRATRVLSYTVTYSGLTPVAGHLHRITPNAANGIGPVEIPFPSLASPIIGTATLTTAGRVDSLLNGFYYSNLHTPTYPGGEIRGDIR